MKRLLSSGFLAAALVVFSQNAWAGGCDPAYAQALYDNLVNNQHMSPAAARFYAEQRTCGTVGVTPPAQVHIHNYPPGYPQTQTAYGGYAPPAPDSGGYYGPTFGQVVGTLAAVGLAIWAIDELSDSHGHHGGHGDGYYYKGGHYDGGHRGGGHYGGYRGGRHGGHDGRHR